MRFVGRYEHSLDVKGRIILPARFRASFDTAAFVSIHDDRCLALWTPEAFERRLDQMQSIQQGIEDLKQGHDAAPDNYSPDVSTQSDDSSGH